MINADVSTKPQQRNATVNKILSIAACLSLLSLSPSAQAEDILASVPELQGENTITVVVPGAIPFDTLALGSPLDNDGGGWKDYIKVDSPEKLVELQKKYGGMLFASVGDLCTNDYSFSGSAYRVYPIYYGLVGAVIGRTGVNFFASIFLDKLIDPLVKEEEQKEGKYLSRCTLVGNNTVVVQFYQS